MSNSNAKFLTDAPMRNVAVMSATASIGLIAMFVVDFVDMIFISMLGNAALAAAIGYAGSILFFTTSFGIGIAIAAGAFATRAMAEFGEAAVAGMAVIGRLVPLAFGVVFALSGAVGPIIGQNYGAGQMDRVKRTFYDALLFTGVVVVVIALALFLLRDPIAALFALEQGPALALLYAFCGPLAILFYFNGAIFVSNAAFNNLGHPYYSTWINWVRHTIGTIPFLYLGGMWFGPVGVLAGPYVGGVIFGLLGLGLARRVMEQSQDSESEVQTHQAHQLRLFHLRR